MQVITDMPPPQQTLWLQSLFLFALVWSVGGNTDSSGRAAFDTYLRRLVHSDVPEELQLFATGQPVKISQMMPEAKSVYDFVWSKERSAWQPWLSAAETKPIEADAEYANIVVPTADTVRCELACGCR